MQGQQPFPGPAVGLVALRVQGTLLTIHRIPVDRLTPAAQRAAARLAAVWPEVSPGDLAVRQDGVIVPHPDGRCTVALPISRAAVPSGTPAAPSGTPAVQCTAAQPRTLLQLACDLLGHAAAAADGRWWEPPPTFAQWVAAHYDGLDLRARVAHGVAGLPHTPGINRVDEAAALAARYPTSVVQTLVETWRFMPPEVTAPAAAALGAAPFGGIAQAAAALGLAPLDLTAIHAIIAWLAFYGYAIRAQAVRMAS